TRVLLQEDSSLARSDRVMTTAHDLHATLLGRRNSCVARTRKGLMTIRRKHLGRFALVVIALFVIAAPLGDKQNGMGKHNALAATVGQTIFVTFLIAFALLIVAAVVSLAQAVARSRAKA